MRFRRNMTFSRLAPPLSMVISLAAVVCTALQWHDARDQLLLTTRPHIDFVTQSDPDEPPLGVEITNAGPGPALIKSVIFYVDRKSVRDAEEAGTTYAHLTDEELGYSELEPDDTLGKDERMWLIQFRKLPRAKFNQKHMEKFGDFVEQNLAIEVTYCSTIRETLCWTKCSTKGRCR